MIKNLLSGLALFATVIVGGIFAYNQLGGQNVAAEQGVLSVEEARLSLSPSQYRSGYKVRAGNFSSDVFGFQGNERRFYTLAGSKTPHQAPIAFYLGTKDHIFNEESARQVSKKLSDAGQGVKLVLLKDHTHWYYSPAKYINELASDFFESTYK